MKLLSKQILLFFLFTLIISFQESYSQTRINARGVYTHPHAKVVFPEQLDVYPRIDIYAFDARKTDIGVVYKDKSNETEIVVYVYPAGEGYEGRLRTEYQKSLQSVALVSFGVHASQHAVRHQGEKYICNGFMAVMRDANSTYNSLTVYECGEWFLKVRVTSTRLDSARVVALEQKIYTQFDPTKLTEVSPLDVKAQGSFSKAAYRDSVLLGSAMLAAKEKINWASVHVAENERASGFPDLYLDMHVAALRAFMQFQYIGKFTMTNPTRKYLDDLQLISDAGFLSEFVMDQFEMILILPEKALANYEAYLDWKQNQKITVDLNQMLYVVSYGEKNEKKRQ
ncbi:MAG: hypothetical protein VB102_00655 [Paludibacter sp.]|nr:hypothetical protein [Paludibacter sp.]